MDPHQLHRLLHPTPGVRLLVETETDAGPTLQRARVVATGRWQTVIEPEAPVADGRALLHLEGAAVTVDLETHRASGRVRITPVTRPILTERRERPRVQLPLPVSTGDGRTTELLDMASGGVRLAAEGELPPTLIVPHQDGSLVMAVHHLGTVGSSRRPAWRLAVEPGDRETAQRWSELVERALDQAMAGHEPTPTPA